ncbi:MAG: tetratricopeptide repeat protein [Gammaproteobacteria bacterium]
MSNKFLFFLIFILSSFTYILFGGIDNIERKSFESFYSSDRDIDYYENLNIRLDSLLKLNSNTPSQMNLLASRLLVDGNYDQASKVFDFYISTYPKIADTNVYSSYAESIYLADDMNFNDQITSLVNESLYLDPSNYKALTLKGLNLYKEKKFNEALKNWAIALDSVETEDQKKSLIVVMNSALKKLEINKNKSTN